MVRADSMKDQTPREWKHGLLSGELKYSLVERWNFVRADRRQNIGLKHDFEIG